MRLLSLVIFLSLTFAVESAQANEWDDAISRMLVIPAKIYEYKEQKWRDCLMAHPAEERLSAMSHWVLMNRELVAKTRDRVAQFQARRAKGESVDAVAEANANRWLPEYEKNLEQSWVGYKNVGGTAESIDKVVEIASPCGPPPRRPTY